ncbi:hypothetical protein BHU72_05700 [Desulfuribacillus stibiiarsenatis]|uniref:Uncharacterized protein n=1 Tax=Desulfuribacillus stibiiarsenatis TaxID=1390249 RepID=A0A1E5L4W5_9FIRM|nr:hypothetical protein [Desulfuribacillus stibiiarsenatis]OEH85104.1 hypothetical protein BHU72_05700 [Desulfuribacillus stibiiarsenatis]
MLKGKKRKIIVTAIIVYILICVVINVFYEKILVNIIGSDEIIFSVFSNLDSTKDERYIAYLDESFVNFSKVKGKAIAPFNLAHIPSVESKYTVDPNNMTFVEGFFHKYGYYYNDDENIQNGVVFEGFEIYSRSGRIHSSSIYLGITDRKIEDCPMEIFSIDSIAEGKNIFMIESKEKINFGDFITILF